MESFPSRVAGAAKGLAGLSGAGKTCHLVDLVGKQRGRISSLVMEVKNFKKTKALKKHMTSNCRVIELCWWK